MTTGIVTEFATSVDNVIASAGAAESSGTHQGMAPVMFGGLVGIPIIVRGTQPVIKLMARSPFIITAGGMLLGWIADAMTASDPVPAKPEAMPSIPKLEAGTVLHCGTGTVGELLHGKVAVERKPTPGIPAIEPARARPLPSKRQRAMPISW